MDSRQQEPGTAVVFGAGGGIGRALVELLAQRGLAVHAGARSLPQGLPAGVQPFTFDLTSEDSVAAALAAIPGPIDLVLVATGVLQDNARGLAPEKTWRALDPAAMAQAFAINAIGPAIIAKHGLPRLRRDGRAVFAALSARVGSIADNRLGGWHSYRASKAALNQIVRTCAVELARTHPKAVAATLHPGTVATPLSAPFQRGVAADRLFTPEHSAAHLLRVIDGLTPADSGGFFAWDGTPIPY